MAAEATAAKNGQRGVTLPELLIALIIFAMIAGAGVYAMRLAVDGREQLDEADARLREWQIARAVIKEDLAQLSPRVVRDEFGVAQPSAFIGGLALQERPAVAGETALIAFVRRGWRNPGDVAPRSSLQYVEYVLKDRTLLRRTRVYLDAAPRHAVTDRALFTDIQAAEASFLVGESSRGLEWAPFWPGPGASGFAPRAVRLTLRAPRLGEIEQLFWIGRLDG